MVNWKKYVLWFAQEHVEFRFAEIQSITRALKIPIKYAADHNEVVSEQPFWLVELQNDEYAKQLASRSISLKCVLELWAHGTTKDQLHTNLRNYLQANKNYTDTICHERHSFKIFVETYNKHFTQKEKVDKIETFDYLPFKGPVNLKNPNVLCHYIEYYGMNPINVPDEPLDSIFGRWLSDGKRSLLKEISLKTRKFIGNTSMDAQLSVLMANQALVDRGHLVMDPFVGTGSLLVAAAKFGAYVMGSDIDYLMLHAQTRPSRITQKIREKDESIRANLKQYHCDHLYMDVLVSDFSSIIWSNRMLFDSIITDPPYGIREATEKIDSKERTKHSTQSETDPHFPSTSNYSLPELYSDLLEFSVKHLKLGGRLVCWIPIHKMDYSEATTIPKHRCLRLVANSEQDISLITSRRLLTYEKIAEFDGTQQSQSIQICDSVGEFRTKFFQYGEETRQERRMRKAEIKEIGRQEALNRGKYLDANGKVTIIKPPE